MMVHISLIAIRNTSNIIRFTFTAAKKSNCSYEEHCGEGIFNSIQIASLFRFLSVLKRFNTRTFQHSLSLVLFRPSTLIYEDPFLYIDSFFFRHHIKIQ